MANRRLTVRRLALLPLAFALACATAPQAGAYGAWARLAMLQRAGAYPPDWAIAGDSHAAQLATLEQWTEEQGYVLAPAHLQRKNLLGHVSRTNLAGWVILVDPDRPANARLYTLLHELAHILGPDKLGVAEHDETFAEVVTTIVCDHIGLSAWPQTASYLHQNVPLDVQERFVASHEKQIDAVVATLTKAVTK